MKRFVAVSLDAHHGCALCLCIGLAKAHSLWGYAGNQQLTGHVPGVEPMERGICRSKENKTRTSPRRMGWGFHDAEG